MTFWKTFWACFLAIFISSILSLLFTLFVVVGIVAAITIGSSQEVIVVENTVLEIDLEDPIVDNLSSDLSEYLSLADLSLDVPSTILSLRGAIERAAIDPKIEGISLRIPLVPAVSSEMIYELREALIEFKEQAGNKFIYSYGEGYTQGMLYLSSVSDRVFLNPVGGVVWVGQSATPIFFKGTLDKLGIEPQIIRYGKFKGAVEPLILSELSEENRQQTQSLIDSNWGYIVSEVASARNLSAEELLSAANSLSIQSAHDAVKYGLVDDLKYIDEVKAWVEAKIDSPRVNYISVSDYMSSPQSLEAMLLSSPNVVKVVYAVGDIVDSGSDSQVVGHDIAKEIEQARADSSVKAIVLRVNSPGGSALASEVIWREAHLASQIKPLIVSMGEYAASGGYWIATPASKIVASPLTVTGSIGVFGVLFDVSKGAKDILGVTADVVKTGPSADFGSVFRPLSTLERRVMQNGVDTAYHKFLSRVSEGRGMATQEVDRVGQGRIWSGIQAKELGLVDELGTLSDAIEIAAQEAGVSGNYRVVTAGDNDISLLGLMFGTTKSLASWASTFAFGSDYDEVIEELLKLQGTLQARVPFTLEIAD